MSDPDNQLRLTGRLVEIAAPRMTPAGVPARNCKLHHQSRQIEAGHPREVECEIEAVALGQVAHLIAQAGLGTQLRLTGFLARKSLRSARLVMHITQMEFVEGNRDGIQTEQDGQQAQG
ncbi:MAG TPA: primosomal replication protein N [Rhodocyclaceae bacterium]|nr:primosomal replication protein N [Rhodocyclaceae bacterium]HMV52644.1 primosomal replication protein N [Rhodocyclaceae bacterium]HNA03684.1 primosomal replication protein N [Rhodocyclaceae bacterium]HNB78920.1 primosomal replication protein N [Rhodocyclaceae bacterium]HNC61109.1 primosomal replication protein N [Rhodocyclaceae bacterium]